MLASSFIGLIGFTISAIVTLVITIHLLRVYSKRKDGITKYFAAFIGTRFLMFFLIAVAWPVYLVWPNLTFLGILFSLVWAVTFISFVFPPLILCREFNLSWLTKYYVGAFLLILVVANVLIWINFSPAIYNAEFEMVVHQVGDLLVNINAWSKVAAVVPLALLFLIQLRKSLPTQLKLRSLLIGVGLLWLSSIDFVIPHLPLIWIGAYCAMSDVLVFSGVIMRPKS